MNDIVSNALDLAVLQPNATVREVEGAAEAVVEYRLASICVAPCNVQLARSRTSRVCAVIGFPHGNTLGTIKHVEAHQAINDGACELDVVVNFGRFLDNDIDILKSELWPIVCDAHAGNVKVKAILETCYYTPWRIREACHLCVEAGVDWVKTSTGFAGGATPEAVLTMIEAVAGQAGVKASGGIKTRAEALMYLDLGCTRLGASRYEGLIL